MGKIRIKQLGAPELEDAQKAQAKKRREAKKQKKKTARAPGLKGGERVVAVGPTEEELAAIEPAKPIEPSPPSTTSAPSEPSKPSRPSKKPSLPTGRRGRPGRSKRYKQAIKLVDKTKTYPLKKAITLLRKVTLSRFSGTVEAHLNVKDKGLSGEISLPHGTGKKIKVAIADEKLLSAIEKGKIDFDLLIATPKMMPRLAKFGKMLGPKGLMPNPKRGTVTEEPEKKLKEFTKGKILFKTEKQVPIIHLVFGKMDFKDNQLIENFQAIINSIGPTKIKKAVIKSTISPGIKVEFDK